MARLFAARFWRDARHYQIAALSTLVVFNLGWIDFGARPANTVLALTASLLTQVLCSRLTGVAIDLRSPLITGLSLSLLLRTEEPLIHAAAGILAIGSKFLLRIDGKHIWNPAGFAIVVLLFATPGLVWISPGSWGSQVWFAALLAFFAILVLGAARRSDIAIFFFGTHAALLFARALWLGDPFAIPVHQLQSGSLLIFTFFMISDPRTSPDSRLGRFIFAASVAGAAHYMAFFMQMRPALYIALIALSPFIFLIDKILPAERFSWKPATQGVPR
jgi:Na+-transporting NADH:ubiquinone oxidoreductase subunit NqrB